MNETNLRRYRAILNFKRGTLLEDSEWQRLHSTTLKEL